MLPSREKVWDDSLHLFTFYCLMSPKKERKMTDFSFLSSCLQDGMYKHHLTFPSTPESAVGGAKEEIKPQ